MFDSSRRRRTLLLLAPVGVAAVGLAGCGHTASASPSVSGTPSASPVSAAKLRDALLVRVNGVTAKASAAGGDYASLPAGSIAERLPSGAKVTPAGCAGATPTGFSPTALAGSPAASAAFKVGQDSISEVLVAPSGTSASTAIDGQFAAKCAHYQESVHGKALRYTVRETVIKGIGEQAEILNVRSSAGAAGDQWSLLYRGARFVGSVSMLGPHGSESAIRELGKQAYAFAAKSLGPAAK